MKLVLIVTICLVPVFCVSQQLSTKVINVGGNTVSPSSSMITFAIGESIVGFKVNLQTVLSQGFIQGRFGSITGLESSSFESIIIYPNPASDRFFIDSSCDCKIDVKDVTGKRLISPVAFPDGVEVSHLSPGIYLVTLFDNQGRRVATQKLFKK